MIDSSEKLGQVVIAHRKFSSNDSIVRSIVVIFYYTAVLFQNVILMKVFINFVTMVRENLSWNRRCEKSVYRRLILLCLFLCHVTLFRRCNFDEFLLIS